MLLGMLGFAFVWLAQLPFGVVQLWWDRRHDVSEVGYLEYVVSSWLSLGGVFLFVCVAIVIVMALARPLRDQWWIPGAAVFVGLGLLFAFVSPYLVPDQSPLRDPQLARAADRLARQQGVPDIPVKVEDVDAYTDEPNAFAAGLGPTRRVILWNTLLGPPFADREVRVVIAHELAHHSRDHIWKSFGWFALLAAPMALLVAVATRGRGGMYEARAVPLALLVVIVLQVAVTPVQNVLSRRLEAEADWVALETARDPRAQRAVFQDLAETSLADPDPAAWEMLLFGTHPSAMDRIGMAEAWRARTRP
jgi:STE24 endopeptidase